MHVVIEIIKTTNILNKNMGCGCSKKKGTTPKRQVVKKNVIRGTGVSVRTGVRRVRIKHNGFSI